MSCLGTIKIGTVSNLQNGVFEFGLSLPNSNTISVWQRSNIFQNLTEGVYRWSVRCINDSLIVKTGNSTIEKKKCEPIANILDWGVYLHSITVLTENQRKMQMPILGAEFKFVSVVVNNIEYENGSEFKISNNEVVWDSLFSLETTDKVRFKYFFITV